MQLLGRQKGETVGQVEAHLRTKPGQSAGSGSILLLDTFVENPLHEVEILAHRRNLIDCWCAHKLARIQSESNSIFNPLRTRSSSLGASDSPKGFACSISVPNSRCSSTAWQPLASSSPVA